MNRIIPVLLFAFVQTACSEEPLSYTEEIPDINLPDGKSDGATGVIDPSTCPGGAPRGFRLAEPVDRFRQRRSSYEHH